MEIEQRSIQSLIPYANNARTHSDEQVAQIAASIREFGWTNPVLVDGDNGIIAGHGRVLAARKLGYTEAPCIELAHLSDAQKRAYVLADNKLAENSGWDADLLALELGGLNDEGFDVSLTGFDGSELDRLLSPEADESEMPDLADGGREPFQQMTFTVHDDQAEQVRRALQAAKDLGDFGDTGNENSNGNALARICETFVTEYGDG